MLQLKKFPDIPVSTREEAGESRPHPGEPRFLLLAREERSFPCVLGKESGVPLASQAEALSTGKARGTPGSCHHSQSPPDVSVHSGKPVFPALPRLSSQGSIHSTVVRGTALWESLVGKPRGKAQSESLVGKPRGKDTDPLIHVNGSLTLLLQLGRKAHVQAPTRVEDCLPCGNSRSIPRSMSPLERNPQVPVPTPVQVLGPGIDGRGIPRGPRAPCMGLAFTDATRAGH